MDAVNDILTTAMTAVTTLTANPLIAAAVAIPLTTSVVILVRRLFKRP